MVPSRTFCLFVTGTRALLRVFYLSNLNADFLFADFQQVIQTFGAKDQDLPLAGQHFAFKSPKEDGKNRNFTIRDFGSECNLLNRV